MKIFGIDASKYQGTIDWAKAKAGGVKFAMLKAVSTNSKGLYIDPYFERNYAECKRLGIPVGVYYYTYAQTKDYADKELAMLQFQSTSSARRTTGLPRHHQGRGAISIHVLREEDDAATFAR